MRTHDHETVWNDRRNSARVDLLRYLSDSHAVSPQDERLRALLGVLEDRAQEEMAAFVRERLESLTLCLEPERTDEVTPADGPVSASRPPEAGEDEWPHGTGPYGY